MVGAASYRRQCLHRLRDHAQSRGSSAHKDARRGDARTIVRSLLAPLAPRLTVSSSSDLDALQRVLVAIAEAEDERILSPREADAALRFTIEKFVERRVSGVLENALAPSKRSWFVIAGEKEYD